MKINVIDANGDDKLIITDKYGRFKDLLDSFLANMEPVRIYPGQTSPDHYKLKEWKTLRLFKESVIISLSPTDKVYIVLM